MKTNIDLDDRLIEQAFAVTGLKTKKELVKRNGKKDLLDLAGEIEFTENFNIAIIAERDYYLPIFTKLELLQGCKDEVEWAKMSSYLSVQR